MTDDAQYGYAVSYAGLTPQDFQDMDTATATTPFATVTSIPTDVSKFSPFKPCTHGQFRFTKLKLVDKFGQVDEGVRSVIDNNGSVSQTPLFPCLGDSYSVQEVKQDQANTVIPRKDNLNTFVQLPPSINQHARVNASFLTLDGKGWRQNQEWESPVRGWLVIDYANASIQIFSTDGNFVREYGVVSGQISKRPFPDSQSASANLDTFMVQLLARFEKEGYLYRFFQNITRTIEATQASPSQYAESMLSILGKPLALTTFGFSMQLALPALTNQSTVPTTATPSLGSVLDYTFPVKLGDKDNVFDGLFGTFSPKGDSFDFDNFKCYHDPDPANQPALSGVRPFYIDPSTEPDYVAAMGTKYSLFAAIVDPFTPIHVYSALLPIQQLQIPPWCISQGLNQIASFFKTGPTLIANDVPAFDATAKVAEDYRLDDKNAPKSTGSIAIPAVSMADFKWLQPYWVDGSGAVAENAGDDNGSTEYNVLDIRTPSVKPLWQTPPYVVTEGYLQMAKPFAAPNSVAKKEEAA